jgi:nicotinamide-nucleotide amidase
MMKDSIAGQPVGRIGPKSDIDLTNAEKVIFTLIANKRSIATAESVTAGGFSYALTRVPGASRTFVGGCITYTREWKQKLLGIPNEICDKGLVTPEITLEMARRVRQKFGTYYGFGITGNAGPTSDTGGTSVGRVYIAIVDEKGVESVQEFDFFGKRDAVREKAVTDGLRMLRNFIEKELG